MTSETGEEMRGRGDAGRELSSASYWPERREIPGKWEGQTIGGTYLPWRGANSRCPLPLFVSSSLTLSNSHNLSSVRQTRDLVRASTHLQEVYKEEKRKVYCTLFFADTLQVESGWGLIWQETVSSFRTLSRRPEKRECVLNEETIIPISNSICIQEISAIVYEYNLTTNNAWE